MPQTKHLISDVGGPSRLIPIRQAPAVVAEIWGVPEPSQPTIGRWTTVGLETRTDEVPVRVKLRTTKVGGRRYTCLAWIEEFLCQVNGGVAVPNASETVEDRKTVAVRELESMGV